MNNELAYQYEQYKSANPKVRIRDAAKELGVTEAELVAVGPNNIRLRPAFEALLNEIPRLGYVMALTRNDYAVHERKGIYTEAHFTDKIGLVVNPEIDLRLFLFSWHSIFAVQEGDRKSIQFFAKNGEAIHKIYLTERSDLTAFAAILEKYQLLDTDQPIILSTDAQVLEASEDAQQEVDVAAFQKDWLALEDTHHFFAMLKKHKVERTKAMEIAPPGHSKAIAVEQLKAVLHQVSEKGIDIMVFVGNKGCIQIHSGKMEKLVQTGPWFNVLDSEFNMHLREDHIAATWLVRKPTVDGIVSSLEVFDAAGELIVQFFGKRKPGIPESEDWRGVLTLLDA